MAKARKKSSSRAMRSAANKALAKAATVLPGLDDLPAQINPLDDVMEPSERVPYSEEVADRICSLLTQKSLRKICVLPGMPHRVTVMRWMEAMPEFAARCARARIEQAEYMDDLIQDTADGTTECNAQANRVKIGAYQWRAARLKPKKYGDKMDLNVGGQPDGVPVAVARIDTTDPVEAARIYQELMSPKKK